jgi:hypothetical protein
VGLKGPSSTTGNAAVQLTLPVDDGSADQYLKTDGSGALSWGTVSTAEQDASSGDYTLTSGNLVIATAGKGIDFSAQTVTTVTGTTASQTTEVLDHYEEGSWTPSCQTGSGGGNGEYVRIGNSVTITGYINPQDTSSSNTVHLENIPYPATTGGGVGWMGAVRGYHINDINGKRAHVAVVDTNDTVQFGTLESANAWTMLKHNNIASTNNAINFTITYRTDA